MTDDDNVVQILIGEGISVMEISRQGDDITIRCHKCGATLTYPVAGPGLVQRVLVHENDCEFIARLAAATAAPLN